MSEPTGAGPAAGVVDLLASIPSPTWSGFEIGPLTIHAYALCIMLGIALALWLTSRRWRARDGSDDDLWDIAIWAIPAGIIGGRIYHVFSTPDPYFGPDGNPIAALYIWNGGLGIWGAVALGVLVVLLVCRRMGVRFTAFLDAAAPGLILAQAVGRWGNWFNQELFGAPTTVPWGLEIDKILPDGTPNPNWPDPALPEGTLFHPTFLYESVWNLVGFVLLIWAGRRFALGHGQVFYLYICYYTLGRVWIEAMRIDTAELILGVRLNVWVSILVFALGAVLFIVSRRRHPMPEESIYTDRRVRRSEDGTDGGSGGGSDDGLGGGPGGGSGGDSDGGSGDGRGGAAKATGASGGGASSGASGTGARDAKDAGSDGGGAGDPSPGDSPEDRPGTSAMSQRSFGFFGAVTSAISIVPQVGPGGRGERRRRSE